MEEDGGRHLAAPGSRTAERGLFSFGAVSLAVGVICAIVGAEASSGFLVLGAACVFGMVLVRMRSDPSAWRLRPGDGERGVVLLVLMVLVSFVAVGAVVQIASSL